MTAISQSADKPNRFSWAAAVTLLCILLCAGLLRSIMFEAVYSVDPTRISQSDTIRYEGPAIGLLTTGTMRDGLDIAHTQDVHEAPAYPYFIYSVYKLFGQSHRALVYAQIMVSLATIALLYFIGTLLWSKPVALGGSALLALAPMQTLYSNILLSETLFVFFMVLLLWCAVRFFQAYETRANVGYALFFGLSIGAASMVRPVAYYLVFCVLLALPIYHYILGRHSIAALLKCAAAILLGFAVIVGPWQLRNKSITGAYLFTDNPGQIMLYWKAAGMIADRDGIDEKVVRANLLAEMPTQYESIAQKHALEKQAGIDIIRGDIPAYVRFTNRTLGRILFGPGLSKFGLYLGGEASGYADPPRSGDGWQQRLEQSLGYKLWYLFVIAYSLVFLALLYIMFLFGSVYFWRQGQHKIVLVFCMALVAYFILASTGHSAADSRMRFPVVPVLILFASFGLANLYTRLRQR